MVSWLIQKDILYILTARIYLAMNAGLLLAWWGGYQKSKHPIPFVQTAYRRGMKVKIGMQAVAALAAEFADEIKRSGVFTELVAGLSIAYSRFKTHFFILGASGTGKSQSVKDIIETGMRLGTKMIILDVKSEFTQAYYQPDNPAHAILDATDRRSVALDFPRDMRKISSKRRFASSFIPAGEGENEVWNNGARSMFVGYQIYAEAKFKDYTPVDIADLIFLTSAKQSAYIFKKYYPQALKTVGVLDERSGAVEENQTSFGMVMNLQAAMDGLNDLARFWYDPEQRRISLHDFMADPDYPVKVLFIKPNDAERLMSSGLIRTALNYMISMIDQPEISNTSELRGIFLLDEFQQPGAMLTEDGKPTVDKLLDRGRSKGWVGILASQELQQLIEEYNETNVKKWRGVVSNFIVTGTPPGETAEMISNMIGKTYFDKIHKTYGTDPQTGKAKVGDDSPQQHEEPTILPTELSSYLTPTDGKIRMLYMARGIKGAYILEKPIVPFPEIEPAWVEQPEQPLGSIENSRIMKALIEEMGGGERSYAVPSTSPEAGVEIPGVSADEYEPESMEDDAEQLVIDGALPPLPSAEEIALLKDIYLKAKDRLTEEEQELMEQAFKEEGVALPEFTVQKLGLILNWQPTYKPLYEFARDRM
ncbi:hypothetical protein MAFF241648_21260 [Ralstonia solanacearum]|nr:hypothetical protein MAFF241648_21260 [Ralstonia solanacearum]